MAENEGFWIDEIASAIRDAVRPPVPRQGAGSPNVFLRYRTERSLDAVLRAIGADPGIRRTLQS